MLCPVCGARANMMQAVTGAQFTARRLACTRPACPKRQGFYTQEQEISLDRFNQLVAEAARAYRRKAKPEDAPASAPAAPKPPKPSNDLIIW